MRIAKMSVLLAALLVAALPLSGAQIPAFDAFYVFGDSLADNGNDFIASQQAVPPSLTPHKTYFKGRFSNGPVAFEYLWLLLTGNPPGSTHGLKPVLESPAVVPTGAVDFAFGGSTTEVFTPLPGGIFVPGLIGQVQMFHDALQGRTPSRRALYGVITGAGDYFAYLNPGQPVLTPAEVVANISFSVESLYLLGARNVLVVNLPDLGKIPLVAGNPQASALLSALSSQHNAALTLSLRELAGRHPDLRLKLIDVNEVLSQLPNSVNQTLPALDALFPPPGPGELPMSVCLFTNPLNCRDVPTFDVRFKFLYWDVEHPTTAIHGLLAWHIFGKLAH